MRFDIVREVFLKELRETMRDRRSLVMMFGIPLLLYPLLTMAMAGAATSTAKKLQEQVARVAVLHPSEAPGLVELLRSKPKEVLLLERTDAESALAKGELEAVIVLPEGLEERALAGASPKVRIRTDGSRTGSAITEGKIGKLLTAYDRWLVEQRLKARGVPISVVEPIGRIEEDVASGEKRFGSRLALLLPMMLLITGMLGAFFPAINVTTAERELSTLETLLVTPATKLELLMGKTILVLLSALLTAGLNMLSMSLVMWRITSQASGGAMDFSVSPVSLLLAYLAAVPTIVFFAALVMLVGLFARNYREANSFATPVMLLSLIPVLISMGDPKATPALLVTPCVNTTLVIRDVLSGRGNVSDFAIAFGSSMVYAALMLSLAGRVFSSESLVNPSWEPLSLKGLRKGAREKGARRLPEVDEALGLFALSLVLLFYVAPVWMKLPFLVLMVNVQLFLIAGPALAAAALFRYQWRETFSLAAAAPGRMIGGALLALGIIPFVYGYVAVQDRFFPRDPEAMKNVERIFRPVLEGPDWKVALTVILVGLVAGVTEEILYRGPIQSAFARKMPAWAAIGITSLLFAGAHMDLHGFLPRAAIGFVLGSIVIRTGSLFPAILMHSLYDTTVLALSRWAPKGSVISPELASTLPPGGVPTLVAQLLLGAALFAAGWWLCFGGKRSRKLEPLSATS